MKVHKQKAKKDYPGTGINSGDTYYWWKFRYGGKQRSKTYPTPKQLTQSSYLQAICDIHDEVEALSSCEDVESLQAGFEMLKENVESLKSETESSLESIPEQLQDGHILKERCDTLENALEELESIDLDDYDEDSEEVADWLQTKIDEIQTISFE